MSEKREALDLFSGARGWSLGAAPLGWRTHGVENWAPARATAEAAGFLHAGDDVRAFHAARGQYDLVIGSPSCKKFSMAGDGTGRRSRDTIARAVHQVGAGFPAENVIGTINPDAALTLEPLRIILECEPRAVALEQAPSVLPIWEAYADVLRARGYTVWTGKVDAADFGVPQNRVRAVLLARNDGWFDVAPRPTHKGCHVSMAEALGWGMTARPSMTVTGGGSYTGGAEPWGNAARKGMRREYEAGRWLGEWRPRPTPEEAALLQTFPVQAEKRMGAGMVERYGERPGRPVDQPAFTIRASAGGMEPGGFRWRMPDGSTRKMTESEASGLQTFPDGYPFQGGKGQRFQQIGNAVPPRLAEALLRVLV